jgi:hypothetical protein
MKRKRCIAFKQSEDYPELLMPCTEPVLNGKSQQRGLFCKAHARAYRELMAGIFNQARSNGRNHQPSG